MDYCLLTNHPINFQLIVHELLQCLTSDLPAHGDSLPFFHFDFNITIELMFNFKF